MALDTNPTRPELVAGGSAALAIVGAFLPWVTAGVQAGPVDVSASVTGIETVGVVSLVLAIAVLALLLVVTTDHQPAATAAGGLLIALVALWKLVDLGGAAEPGIGLYLTLVAGLGVLVGGAWAHAEVGSGGGTPG